MIDRRRTLACLAAGTGTIVWADEAARIPPFSAAPAGIGVPAGWRHQTLPKVERTNEFAIVADEGRHVLQVRSRSSASWVTRVQGDAVSASFLQWSWKVSRSLAGSDLRTRQGDDYAAHLYVLFDLPLERLSLGDRLRIQASRAVAGVDVPSAALCYVWGSAQPAGSSAWNPYTGQSYLLSRPINSA